MIDEAESIINGQTDKNRMDISVWEWAQENGVRMIDYKKETQNCRRTTEAGER